MLSAVHMIENVNAALEYSTTTTFHDQTSQSRDNRLRERKKEAKQCQNDRMCKCARILTVQIESALLHWIAFLPMAASIW